LSDVIVSIVNHHHVDLLPRCIDSVLASRGVAARPVVLDNHSPDGSAAMVRQRFPDVELIAQTYAEGFGANNNTVIGPRLERARYFLLLNDDAFLEPDALQVLLTFMDAHPEVGIAGARLLYPDGSPQSSYAGFPTGWDEVFYLWGLGKLVPKKLRRRLATVLRPFSRLLPRLGRVYLENWLVTHDTPIEVDWVCGAALMARRETIQQIGLLDADAFFMYYEDTDWCLRARQAGWKVSFVPGAVVHHYQQASRSHVTRRAWVESGIRYFTKHGMPFDAWLLRVNVGAHALVTLGWSTLRWLFDGFDGARLRRAIADQRDLLRVVRSAVGRRSPLAGSEDPKSPHRGSQSRAS
jgi:N-acetylglucosaminyl-diphospho-decaprenol L-rhamnosyltransferase